MRRATILPLLALPFLAVAACGRADPTLARTEQGPARGEVVAVGSADSVVVFRGLPYARPPVDTLRWRAPVPPEPWTGERDVTEYAPSCPQSRGPDGTAAYYRRAARRLGRDTAAVPELVPTSEDCLYLNVWTPVGDGRGGSGDDGALPVFVWVHGGAGTSGSGSDPLFDGRELAARGLVVVTLSYRLGALGFLAHPSLSAEDPAGVSGNYALLDVIRALDWVRRNARAFGGDPERVTVAGQSSGASLVELLMVAPPARGLFQRVVLQSATLIEPPLLRGGDASAEAAGERFVAALGLPGDANAAALRAVPADSLVAAMARAGGDAPVLPVVDGRVLPDRPIRMWTRGEAARVPMLEGSADDEFALFMPPPAPGDDPAAHGARVRRLSDEAFRAPAVLMLRWTEGRSPVWFYRFAWRPGDGGDPGAFHGVDLPFLFGTHRAAGWWDDSPDVEALTDAMQSAWVRFAATGDPGWPPASPDTLTARVFDGQAGSDASVRTDKLPDGARIRDMADRLAEQPRHNPGQ